MTTMKTKTGTQSKQLEGGGGSMAESGAGAQVSAVSPDIMKEKKENIEREKRQEVSKIKRAGGGEKQTAVVAVAAAAAARREGESREMMVEERRLEGGSGGGKETATLGTEVSRENGSRRTEVERTGERRTEGRGDGARETEAAALGAAAAREERSTETEKEMDRRKLIELVINVELEGEEDIPMFELLRAVEVTCGRVVGCRSKMDKKWELTMGNPRGKERLLDGFKIRNTRIVASEVVRDTKIVSFLHLPIYITDDQLINKLTQWGVEQASPIKRRKWAGTEILDGTRFLKVKFNENIKSLPYSTKFETLEGVEYFRVLHDNQTKVCRLCLQPGHILRDCPDFRCFRCGVGGHYARECQKREERDPKTDNDNGEGEAGVNGEDDAGVGETSRMGGGQEQGEEVAEESMEESRVSGREGEEEGDEGEEGKSDDSVLESCNLIEPITTEMSPMPKRTGVRETSYRMRSRSTRREQKTDSSALLPCAQPTQSAQAMDSEEELRWERNGKSSENSGIQPKRLGRKARKKGKQSYE